MSGYSQCKWLLSFRLGLAIHESCRLTSRLLHITFWTTSSGTFFPPSHQKSSR